MSKVLYRYEIGYKNYDDGDTRVYLREFTVLEETDKTYLIKTSYWQKKRIRKTSYNAYAHNQKEKALDHFIRRTCKRVDWYEFWIKECKKSIQLAEKIKGDLELEEIQYEAEDYDNYSEDLT